MRIFFIWMLILLFIITASDRTVRAQAVGLVTITAQNAATVNLLGALWHEFSQSWPIAIPSPDGRRLLSYGSLFFGSLRLWDLESLTTVATIAVTDEMKTDTGLPLGLDNHVQAIFSPDSSTLVISGSRYSGFATIQIWDATSGTIQGGSPMETRPCIWRLARTAACC